MFDGHRRVVGIYTPIAQVYEHIRWLDLVVLHQDAGPLQLRVQGVTVIRIAREGPGAHDQVVFERAGNTEGCLLSAPRLPRRTR